MAAVTPATPGRAATPAAMIGFVSPRTGAPLSPEAGGDALVSAVGERVPIVGGIPRFVSSDDYAAAFGLQWNLHARDRKSTRLNSSHLVISYAVFCLKKKKT